MGPAAVILVAMSIVDHDFILASLARDRIDRALAEATRHRLAREARQAREAEATARAGGEPVLTPARSDTR